jgi:hypothetical protein
LAGKRIFIKIGTKIWHFDSRSIINIKLDYQCIGKIEIKDRLQLGYSASSLGVELIRQVNKGDTQVK